MEGKDKKDKSKKSKKDSKKLEKTEEKNEQKSIPEDKVIQIPLHLLMRFRNIFEITNAQMHWKTQDLLPVGMIIRDVDRIIGAHIEKPENTDNK